MSSESVTHIESLPQCPQTPVSTTSLSQVSDTAPYHPFSSLEDFIFANTCIRNHVKAKVIDTFLQQHSRITNSPITFKNAKQMYRILDHATNLSTKVRTFHSSPQCAAH